MPRQPMTKRSSPRCWSATSRCKRAAGAMRPSRAHSRSCSTRRTPRRGWCTMRVCTSVAATGAIARWWLSPTATAHAPHGFAALMATAPPRAVCALHWRLTRLLRLCGYTAHHPRLACWTWRLTVGRWRRHWEAQQPARARIPQHLARFRPSAPSRTASSASPMQPRRCCVTMPIRKRVARVMLRPACGRGALRTRWSRTFTSSASVWSTPPLWRASLTLRRRAGVKSQDPSQQVRVRREDRVRLVRMPAVKPAVAPGPTQPEQKP